MRDNDIVLYDRQTDPDETVSLAYDQAYADLVDSLTTKLEALIDTEIGADDQAWVPEKPLLLGAPRWRGDSM